MGDQRAGLLQSLERDWHGLRGLPGIVSVDETAHTFSPIRHQPGDQEKESGMVDEPRRKAVLWKIQAATWTLLVRNTGTNLEEVQAISVKPSDMRWFAGQERTGLDALSNW
jgi:hypothetical protein